MYSNLVPFENIIDAVKDETGLTNLSNLYPQIRRFIYRIEKDIGFGGGALLKKITYSKSDNTIVDLKFKLPSDLLYLESVGMCNEGLCPGDYRIQGTWGFLCKDVESFSLLYYTIICDGEGNPAITENHFDTVVAGIKYYLYEPKLWNGEGNLNYGVSLRQYYFDRIGEAIGNDVMPSNKEWSKISQLLRMSYRDILIYSSQKKCYCSVNESANNQVIEETGTTENNDMVYFWQYNDLTSDISLAPEIDQNFLDSKSNQSISSFLNGYTVPYSEVGRIGFAIKSELGSIYKITDVFGTDITLLVFSTYYNETLKTRIYISKEYYSHGNIYFKLIQN